MKVKSILLSVGALGFIGGLAVLYAATVHHAPSPQSHAPRPKSQVVAPAIPPRQASPLSVVSSEPVAPVRASVSPVATGNAAQVSPEQPLAQDQPQAAKLRSPKKQGDTPAQETFQCINNLLQIEAAKNQWALEHDAKKGATPTVQDLLPYLQDRTFPTCPAGGVYSIKPVATRATCTIQGHVIPK